MAEYLSKVLLKSLKDFADKGILNCSVPAGHLITLRDRGYIETGRVGEYDGFVVSEKGRRALQDSAS